MRNLRCTETALHITSQGSGPRVLRQMVRCSGDFWCLRGVQLSSANISHSFRTLYLLYLPAKLPTKFWYEVVLRCHDHLYANTLTCRMRNPPMHRNCIAHNISRLPPTRLRQMVRCSRYFWCLRGVQLSSASISYSFRTRYLLYLPAKLPTKIWYEAVKRRHIYIYIPIRPA